MSDTIYSDRFHRDNQDEDLAVRIHRRELSIEMERGNLPPSEWRHGAPMFYHRCDYGEHFFKVGKDQRMHLAEVVCLGLVKKGERQADVDLAENTKKVNALFVAQGL